MLYPVGKQAFNLELRVKWRIHNVFYISLLEQDTTRKKWMNEFTEVPKFELGNNKEYELEAIQDNAVYTKKANRHLLGLYYLVA